MRRGFVSFLLALGSLSTAAAALAATNRPAGFAATSPAGGFAARGDEMRAAIRPLRTSCPPTPWCPQPNAESCRPASPPTTQIVVVNVNAPVGGDVVVVQSGPACRPASVIGTQTTIAGRPTVQPVVNPAGQVVVRRW